MTYNQNPNPGGHEIYNFDRPFLGHQYYRPLHDGLHKQIFKIIDNGFLCVNYMFTPYHNNACPVGHGIYNFTRPSHGHNF